jgi:hypothetical protein
MYIPAMHYTNRITQSIVFRCNVFKINGGQGRIRTFVPRKEGQIYSLLALTTHPPVHIRFPGKSKVIEGRLLR